MKMVHFAIPVSARRDDAQWSRVNELLKLTLGSILNQTSDRYKVFVCGHDRPEVLSEYSLPSIKFIGVDFPLPQTDKAKRRDKRRKRWEIAREVRRLGGGYYMFMDADDLVHRDFVQFITSNDNQVGYLIKEGYALDFANRRIAPIPGAFNRDFNRVCGSSGAVYLLPEDLPDGEYDPERQDLLYTQIRNHKYFEEGRMRGGKTLTALPFAAGIYTLNNSINLSNLLVRTEERQLSLIEGIKTLALPDLDSIGREFGLTEFLEPKAALPPGPQPALNDTSPSAIRDNTVDRSEANHLHMTSDSNNDSEAPSKRARPSDREARTLLRPHAKQMASLLGYAETSGWLRSASARRPVDADGKPLPWYTYPAISFLTPRIKPDFSVFEYGSGNSTLWWAGKVKKVRAVEHDPVWSEIVRGMLPENARLDVFALEAGGAYSKASLAANEKFDVIVIDGRDRINCAHTAVTALTSRGVLVWDNTERRRYHSGFGRLYELGFRRLEFRGLAPIRAIALETSIFYRPDNCLGI
jgi:hypothetical protein